MHLYLGMAKVAKGRPISDYRFFVRSIIRYLLLFLYSFPLK